MVSATNSLARRAASPAALSSALSRRTKPVWVLGIKTDAFARVAWERGRDVALALERRVFENLRDVVAETLRGGDVLVHTPASDVFGVALLERSGLKVASAADLPFEQRGVLASIERTVRDRAGVEVFTGWTLLGPSDDPMRAFADAAERGRNFVRRREFATLLHDLTTPVSSIYGSLVAATDGILPHDVADRFLANARSEAGRVGRLIRGFLAAQEDEVRACDAFDALARSLAALEPLALARDVSLRMCEASQRAATAMCEDKLTAIVVSLLENAIKHGRAGGRVRARSFVSGERTCIEIDDDGPGVPAESLERIFQFGARAGDAEGTGIGLAHARLLVVAAGGDIAASRSPLGGARFTLRLPSIESRGR